MSCNFRKPPPFPARFLAFQEAENSCAGAPNLDLQLGKRPKSVGWMAWTG